VTAINQALDLRHRLLPLKNTILFHSTYEIAGGALTAAVG